MKNKYKDPNAYTINVHQSNYTLREGDLAYYKNWFEKAIHLKKKPIFFGSLAIRIFDNAQKVSYAEEDEQYLKIALDFLVELYDFAKEGIEQEVTEKTITIDGFGAFKANTPTSYITKSTYNWLNAMSLALIFKDEEKIVRLSQVPLEMFGCLPHRETWVEIWLDLLNDKKFDPNLQFKLAISQAEKRVQEYGPKSILGLYTTHLSIPMLEVFRSIVLQEKTEINEKLVAAFRGHRFYYDRKRGRNRGDLPLKDSFESCFPLKLIGLYCLSKKVFQEDVNIETGYIPSWLS